MSPERGSAREPGRLLMFSHPGDEVFSDACHPSEGYTSGGCDNR